LSDTATSARDGALAQLAAEAARFAATPAPVPPATRASAAPPARPVAVLTRPSPADDASPAGYVPVAVAPERGNTRPVVPVDGRIHMRMARATIDALDEIALAWRADDPVGLRDLERATLVRVGVAMLLADVGQNGAAGAVGEAIRAALDPAIRHTDEPLPRLTRWLRSAPSQATVDADLTVGQTAAAASG
jgi:hypothetical protein